MSLTLYLNRQEWFRHLERMENLFPGYVPVIKGNGYGFGNRYLADGALQSGKGEIAVGTVEEARLLEATHSFEHRIVLTPVMTEPVADDLDPGRVYTVGSRDHLQHLATSVDSLLSRKEVEGEAVGPFRLKILIKCQSSMKRYGFSLGDAAQLPKWIREVETERVKVEVRGLSIHFPKEGISPEEKEKEIKNWLETMKRVDLTHNRIYVSHLSSDQYKSLCHQWPNVHFSMRLGTDLWLADKSFLATKSTVLDIQKIRRGERFGYKQLRARRSGHLVFVAGGTANGVALEAPAAAKGIKERLKLTAFWVLSLFNLHMSPFTHRGKRLWFAEPPHMQTSVLFFPGGAPLPEVGEELPVQLRMTTADFDRMVETGTAEERGDKTSVEREQEEKGNVVDVAL